MTRKGEETAIKYQMIKCEVIEGLERAIDRSYRRLLQAARNDWERLFAGKDPSSACVSVRISTTPAAIESSTAPRAGYLSKPASPPTGKTRPRLA